MKKKELSEMTGDEFLRFVLKNHFSVISNICNTTAHDWSAIDDLPMEEIHVMLDDARVSDLHTTPMKDWTMDDYTLLKKRGLYP